MTTPQSPPAGDELDNLAIDLVLVGLPKDCAWVAGTLVSPKRDKDMTEDRGKQYDEAKAALQAYILAEVLKAKPRKQQLVLQQTKLTDYQLGYNEGISDFEKAATARFGGKS